MRGSFMMMFWGVFIAVIGVMGLWKGGQDIFVALTNSKPTTATCKDFVEGKVSAYWLHLTDCVVDYRNAVIVYDEGYDPKGDMPEVYMNYYAPVFHKGAKKFQAISLLKEVRHRPQKTLMKTLERLKKRGGKAYTDFLAKNAKQIRAKESIKGILLFGIDVKSNHMETLKNKIPNSFAKDAKVLQEGRKPMGTGAGMMFLVMGMVFCLGGGGLCYKGWKGATQKNISELKDLLPD